MPRQYTQTVFQPGNIASAGDPNAEINTVTSEFNGLLDQNQMPLAAVGVSKFAPSQVVVDYAGFLPGWPGHNINHSYMQSQSYHVSEHYGAYTGQGPFLPYTTFSKLDWTLGWIKLASKRGDYDGTQIQPTGAAINFEAKEGMLVGEIQMDAEWRQTLKRYQSQGQFAYFFTFWDATMIEVGVFVNDVIVATTDLQSLGGRYTYTLPFSTPIGTQSVTVDIRFRLVLNNSVQQVVNPTFAPPYIEDYFYQDFRVYDSLIWVRNQYR